ncbi:MAG: nitroreductase family protein [Candidatus Aureabacteria bacterium]|nr:nitroreductase family protein [Candidatus Auribacterota bacterium]
MADIFDVIKNRRSIRNFSGDDVPETDIRKIIECAVMAPSGSNQQPWKFVVVRDRAMKNSIAGCVNGKISAVKRNIKSAKAEEHLKGYMQYLTFFQEAPVVICVLTQPYRSVFENILHKYMPEEEKEEQALVDASIQSVSAAVQNLLLAAHAMGYGTCWMTGPIIAQREIEQLLGVEKPWHLTSVIPLGKPRGASPGHFSRKTVDEVLIFKN